ncbi:MAG: 4Fe-4S binding protein, partial [bacterium]
MARRRIAPHRIVQIIATVILNGYILAYVQGKILYSGFLKSIPEPVLNCYGGPLSMFACPLGSFQQILGQQGIVWWQRVPWVVLGVFIVIGAFVGRAACGWLCPFGLWQDLLYKIKLGKRAGGVRWVGFAVVAGIGLIMVILLALFLKVAVWKSLLFGWVPFIGLFSYSILKGKMALPRRWWLGSMLVGVGVGVLIGIKFEVNLGIAAGAVALTVFSLVGGAKVIFLAAPVGFVLALLGRPGQQEKLP